MKPVISQPFSHIKEPAFSPVELRLKRRTLGELKRAQGDRFWILAKRSAGLFDSLLNDRQSLVRLARRGGWGPFMRAWDRISRYGDDERQSKDYWLLLFFAIRRGDRRIISELCRRLTIFTKTPDRIRSTPYLLSMSGRFETISDLSTFSSKPYKLVTEFKAELLAAALADEPNEDVLQLARVHGIAAEVILIRLLSPRPRSRELTRWLIGKFSCNGGLHHPDYLADPLAELVRRARSQEALELVARIGPQHEQERLQVHIVRVLIRQGDYEPALSQLQEMNQNSSELNDLLVDLITGATRCGKVKVAMQAALLECSSSLQVELGMHVLKALARCSDSDLFMLFISQLETRGFHRSRKLMRMVILLLAEKGEAKRALQVCEYLEKPELIAQGRKALLERYSACGHDPDLLRPLMISELPPQAEGPSDLMEQEVKSLLDGFFQQVFFETGLMDDLMGFAESFGRLFRKDPEYNRLLRLDLIDEAMKQALETSDLEYRLRAVSEVSVPFHNQGQQSLALELLDSIKTWIPNLEHRTERIRVYCALVRSYAELGYSEQTQAAVSQARAVIQELPKASENRFHAWTILFTALSHCENSEPGLSVYRDMMDELAQLPSENQLKEALVLFETLLKDGGRPWIEWLLVDIFRLLASSSGYLGLTFINLKHSRSSFLNLEIKESPLLSHRDWLPRILFLHTMGLPQEQKGPVLNNLIDICAHNLLLDAPLYHLGKLKDRELVSSAVTLMTQAILKPGIDPDVLKRTASALRPWWRRVLKRESINTYSSRQYFLAALDIRQNRWSVAERHLLQECRHPIQNDASSEIYGFFPYLNTELSPEDRSAILADFQRSCLHRSIWKGWHKQAGRPVDPWPVRFHRSLGVRHARNFQMLIQPLILQCPRDSLNHWLNPLILLPREQRRDIIGPLLTRALVNGDHHLVRTAVLIGHDWPLGIEAAYMTERLLQENPALLPLVGVS